MSYGLAVVLTDGVLMNWLDVVMVMVDEVARLCSRARIESELVVGCSLKSSEWRGRSETARCGKARWSQDSTLPIRCSSSVPASGIRSPEKFGSSLLGLGANRMKKTCRLVLSLHPH